MSENIEIQETNVEIFYLTEDEELFIEVSDKAFFLSNYENNIDLTKPYTINNLTVIQDEDEVLFPSKMELDVFLEIYQEIKNENIKS